jgi:hypothetical protein
VEVRQIAPQLLEMIAWRRPQVMIGRRVVDHLDLAEEPTSEIGRDVPRLLILDEEGAQPLVPKAHDHAAAPPCVCVPPFGTQCNCLTSHHQGWRSDD